MLCDELFSVVLGLSVCVDYLHKGTLSHSTCTHFFHLLWTKQFHSRIQWGFYHGNLHESTGIACYHCYRGRILRIQVILGSLYHYLQCKRSLKFLSISVASFTQVWVLLLKLQCGVWLIEAMVLEVICEMPFVVTYLHSCLSFVQETGPQKK